MGYIARCYSFKKMNERNYGKIIQNIYLFTNMYCENDNHMIITNIFKNCIEVILEDNNHQIIGVCKITYDYIRSCCCLFTCEVDSRKSLFITFAELLSNLFESDSSFHCFPVVHAICVCFACRMEESSLSNNSWIPLNQIEELATQGTAFYYCDKSRPVRIDLLAPGKFIFSKSLKYKEFNNKFS